MPRFRQREEKCYQNKSKNEKKDILISPEWDWTRGRGVENQCGDMGEKITKVADKKKKSYRLGEKKLHLQTPSKI